MERGLEDDDNVALVCDPDSFAFVFDDMVLVAFRQSCISLRI